MLLMKRITKGFSIPRTSSCEIITRGEIHDGDIVDVISPLFSSYDFTSKLTNISESFKIKVNFKNKESKYIKNNSVLVGTLVCEDNSLSELKLYIWNNWERGV